MEYTATTNKLLEQGFTLEQVQAYARDKMSQASAKGFSDEQVQVWAKTKFGFDFSNPRSDTLSNSFIAGYQNSVTGLMTRDKVPDKALSDKATFWDKLMFGAGQFAGDAPWYAAGFVLGGGAGASASVPTGGLAAPVTVPLGAMGGAMALPEGMRYLYLESLKEGKVHNFEQFVGRLGGALEASAKGWLTGASAGLAGRAALPAAAAIAGRVGLGAKATQLAGTAASTTAEVGAATVVGAGLNGHVPTADDFVLGMAMVSGTKVASHTAAYFVGKGKAAFAESGFNTTEYIQKNPLSQRDVEYIRSKNQLYPPDVAEQVKGMREGSETFPAPKQDIAGATSSTYEPQNAFDRAWSKGWDTITAPLKGKLYDRVFDSLDPIKQHSAEPAMQELYQEIRKIPNAATKANRAIFEGLYDLDTGQQVGPGLKQALSGITDRASFERFLQAKQSAALVNQGHTETVSLEALNKAFTESKLKPEQQASLDYILKARQQLIWEGERAGYFSREVAKNLMARNETLLPLSRQLGAKNPNWNLLVDAAPLRNPAEVLIQDTYKLYRQFEVNKNKAALFNEVYRVPTPEKPLGTGEAEVVVELGKNGKIRRPLTAEEIFAEEGVHIDQAPMDFWNNGKYTKVAMPADLVKALDSLTPQESSVAVQFMQPFAKGTRLGTVMNPDFWVRMSGVDFILAPFFSKNNFAPIYGHLSGAKTLLGSWLYQKNPKLFAKMQDFDTLYNKAVSNGAFGASYVTQDMTPSTLRAVYGHTYQNMVNLFKASDVADLKKALNPWTNVKYGVHRVVDFLGHATETLDKIPRIEEFRLALENGKNPKAAAFDAREINLDFTRSAVQLQAMNRIVAFFNPALQSAAKIGSMVKNQPTAFLTRGLLGITLPSFYIAMAKQDILHNSPDSEAAKNIRAESQVDADFCWTFYNADGDGYKYRVPFEIGTIFKLPADQLAKFLYDESEDKNLLSQMWQDGIVGKIGSTFIPPVMPNVVAPFVEPWVNYNLFPDRPMISGWMQRVAPQLRSGEATTQLAKELSIALNGFGPVGDVEWTDRYLSPQAIDHMFTSWTGGAGRNIMFMADRLLQKAGVIPYDFKDWGNWDHIPVLQSFRVRNPSAAAQPLVKARERLLASEEQVNSLRKIYEYGDEYSKLHKQLLGLPKTATIEDIKEAEMNIVSSSGAIRELAEFSKYIRILTHRTKFDRDALVGLVEGIKAISDSDKVMLAIHNSQGEFTPELKEAMIEELRWQQIALAERINAELDILEKKKKKEGQ